MKFSRLTLAFALLAVGCAAATTPSPSPDRSPSDHPSGAIRPTASVASPAATPSAAAPAVIFPERMWGDWQADGGDQIPGLFTASPVIQLSVNWDGGRDTWVQVDGQRQVVGSYPTAASPTEFEVTAKFESDGCRAGDIGHYRWNRSVDGLFLNISLLDDQCDLRGRTLARIWVHSLSAVTDGGPGVVGGPPTIQMTVPKMRWGLHGDHAIDLTTFEQSDPKRAFLMIRDPAGYGAPCAADDQRPVAIKPTTNAFVAYVRGLPGVSVRTADAKVGSLPAVHIAGRVASAVVCPLGGIVAFRPNNGDEDENWSLDPGEAISIYLVTRDGHLFMMSYTGDKVQPPEEQSVIQSITFIDALPKP